MAMANGNAQRCKEGANPNKNVHSATDSRN